MECGKGPIPYLCKNLFGIFTNWDFEYFNQTIGYHFNGLLCNVSSIREAQSCKIQPEDLHKQTKLTISTINNYDFLLYQIFVYCKTRAVTSDKLSIDFWFTQQHLSMGCKIMFVASTDGDMK
jgi:hypothetical protein